MNKKQNRASIAGALLLALLVWWHTSPAEALEGWTTELIETPIPVVINQLNQAAATAPQVYIVSPRPEEVIADTNVAVQLQVAGTPIFKNAQLGLGPHLHLLLDRVPTESIYDLNTPITLSNLSPGTHTLQVLANKPWHESWKNPQAFAQVTFHVLAKSTDSPNPQSPQLILVQPTEIGAEPWLLDFYVANAPSHVDAQHPLRQIADWRVRATVNEQSFEVNRAEPIYLRGLRPGVNVLKLEYLNTQGQVADRALRVVKYQPNGNDGLSRLVRNELSIDQALGLFNPQSRLAVPTERSSTTNPTIQQPTMPWNQVVPSMQQDSLRMQSNSGFQRDLVMQGNPGTYDNSGSINNSETQNNSGIYGNSGAQNNSGIYGNSGAQNNSGLYGNSGAQNNSGLYGNSETQNNLGIYGNSEAQNNSGLYGNSRAQNNSGLYGNSGVQNNLGLYGNSGAQNNPGLYGNSGAQNNPGLYGNSGAQNNPGLYGNSGAQNNPGTYGNSGAQSNPGTYGNSGTQSNPGFYGNSEIPGNLTNPVAPRSTSPTPSRILSDSAEILQPKLPPAIAPNVSDPILSLPQQAISINSDRKEIAFTPPHQPPKTSLENIAPPIFNPHITESKESILAISPAVSTGNTGDIDLPTQQPAKTTADPTPQILPSQSSATTPSAIPSPSNSDKISNASKEIAQIDPQALPPDPSEKAIDFKAIGQELWHNTSTKIKQVTNQIPPLAKSWSEKFRHWVSDRIAAMQANSTSTTFEKPEQPDPVRE